MNLQTEIKEHLRDTVKYQVDRTTHSEKLRDFHEWIKAVKKDTLHYVGYACRPGGVMNIH